MSSTVLVVDDDVMSRKMACFALNKANFNTVSAGSGEEAFEALEKEIPDLILLDVDMPYMDGFQVIKKIKANEKYCEIPVIFLTGNNDMDTEVRCFKEGAQDFISKPFAVDVAIQRVTRTLELHKLQRQMEREVHRQTQIAEERAETIRKLSDEVIMAMAAAIDAKDPDTNGHSKRVAEYATMIAKIAGKNETEQHAVFCAAILHDIGKIGIPGGIINKPGGLDADEYEVIREHPVIGANILKNITQIPEVVTGAKYHHERYDGTGYPEGLKGEDIPEIARIISVADSYDTMTSKRSYRPICEQSYVRNEIALGAGTQFDPVFAKIMLDIIDSDKEYKYHA